MKPNETKKCNQCHEEKALDAFYKYKGICKLCKNLNDREYRSRNKKQTTKKEIINNEASRRWLYG